MKKCYDEVRRCESIIRDALARARVEHTLALRQLYHDREEVTGYCATTSVGTAALRRARDAAGQVSSGVMPRRRYVGRISSRSPGSPHPVGMPSKTESH